MSYNYSEFKKKKKDNFKPSMPPPDNPVPSGLIKDITRTGSEDFIHEYKNIEGDICFYVKKKQDRNGKVFTPMSNQERKPGYQKPGLEIDHYSENKD